MVSASDANLALDHVSYALYGVKYIDLVSLAPCAGIRVVPEIDLPGHARGG